MDIGHILKLAMAILTAAVGVLSIIKPVTAAAFTGFGKTLSPRAISEMRAIMGGLFVALGLAPILLNRNVVYVSLGIGYLTVGIVRALSIFVLDKDKSSSSILSLVWEVAFGVLLIVLPTSTIPA